MIFVHVVVARIYPKVAGKLGEATCTARTVRSRVTNLDWLTVAIYEKKFKKKLEEGRKKGGGGKKPKKDKKKKTRKKNETKNN